MRSLGDSGAVAAALMRCGEEVARGEDAAGALLGPGRSRRESRAWRGGRMSNVEGEGRGGGWGLFGVIPPGLGAAEGMMWIYVQ